MSARTQGIVIFVGVLLVLRFVLRLRVSIVGSLVLTFFVWIVVDELNRRRKR